MALDCEKTSLGLWSCDPEWSEDTSCSCCGWSEILAGTDDLADTEAGATASVVLETVVAGLEMFRFVHRLEA